MSFQVCRRYSVSKTNHELIKCLSPIPAGSGPLLCDINHAQDVQDIMKNILFEQQGLVLNNTWLEHYYIPIDSNGYCGDTVLEYIKMIKGEYSHES